MESKSNLNRIRVYCEHCSARFFTYGELKGLSCINCKKIIVPAAAKVAAIDESLIKSTTEDYDISADLND